MKKRILYYVVEVEIVEIEHTEGAKGVTGNEVITLYEIEDNKLKMLCTIESSSEENPVNMIEQTLIEDEFSPEYFELIKL